MIRVDQEIEGPFCASVTVMQKLFSPMEPKNRSSRYGHGEWVRDQNRGRVRSDRRGDELKKLMGPQGTRVLSTE